MGRFYAFEFNDLPRAPRFLRDSIVETLGTGLRWGRVYDAAGPLFADFVRRARCDTILDLCSGTGEPVSLLLGTLARQGRPAPRFLLSDLLPNVPAMERVAARHPGKIEVIREPVDATAVPARFDGAARTVIDAFHHFPPGIAARLLLDAVRMREAILILEAFPRSLGRLAAVVPAMGAAMLANPFRARRERLAKLLFTYLVPLIPAAGLWDAVVSALRVYTEGELRDMVKSATSYEWDYRELPYFPWGRAVAFSGIPSPGGSGSR